MILCCKNRKQAIKHRDKFLAHHHFHLSTLLYAFCIYHKYIHVTLSNQSCNTLFFYKHTPIYKSTPHKSALCVPSFLGLLFFGPWTQPNRIPILLFSIFLLKGPAKWCHDICRSGTILCSSWNIRIKNAPNGSHGPIDLSTCCLTMKVTCYFNNPTNQPTTVVGNFLPETWIYIKWL